ncbi:hypothetical protein Q2T41_16950 [Maribacter confluentis]|uniref:ATPase AAA-type core domain-containing protein n=1 Tax=Maribacter confluentis TaxID=1656093 RepID=A0ABT8RUF1_9FLAO|nr:AAA family ATPase [Maribacter confluentis]MDO1514345.1 hypothetical protein [Maribacter confluentis]
MRLASIYIAEHEFIFDQPVIMNFGGKYSYDFTLHKNNTVDVGRTKNENFIDGFFDQTKLLSRLELITAIVGRNGTGKSSVLDIIRSFFIENSYGLPYSKTIALFEDDENDLPYVLESDFRKVEYVYSFDELVISEDYENLSIVLEKIDFNTIQTIFYSPHFDYKYNLKFDEIDIYDISFDKILEQDLDDLSNKDTNSNGWAYSPSQELIFKNSIRQLLFLSSPLVKENKIFKDIFELPEHGEAILYFRGHASEKVWNTPSGFRSGLADVKKKIKQEIDDWVKIRVFDDKANVQNQIDINKYLCKRYIISDIISILERQMEKNNSFLSEGQITIKNFEEEILNLTALDSFLLFIKSSKIEKSVNSRNAFDFDSINILIKTLHNYIDQIENVEFVQIDNIQIEAEKVVNILNLQRIFLLNLFNYYPKFRNKKTEKPLIEATNKIDGFINYVPTTKRLSSGENALLNLFSRFYDFINNNLAEESQTLPNKNHYILLLDEADLAFHPSWKRKFIKSIISTIPFFFHHLPIPPTIQIIFTTHDPLTLSDIPQSNVVYLDKNKNNTTIVNHDKLQSFGANVHDLLAHSFFLEDGFMGEFAQDVITDLINFLTYNRNEDPSLENIKYLKEWDNEKAKKVIAIIDESMIKERVQSLYNEKVLYHDKELLRQEIRKLNNQLKNLEDETNKDK